MVPINTVDKSPFWELIFYFQPCYPLPSRKIFTDMIPPKIEETKSSIMDELASGKYISFTTDIWTETKTNFSFISLTAHWINPVWLRRDFVLGTPCFPGQHTGSKIAEKINELFAEWGLMPNNDIDHFYIEWCETLPKICWRDVTRSLLILTTA